MSTLGSFLIGILIAAAGAMAIPLAILFAFFEVKQEQREQLSRRGMAVAIFFLALFILGCVNLYMVCNIGNEDRDQPIYENPTKDSQEPDGQDGEDGPKQDDGETVDAPPEEDLSPEELLVKQNWDVIQELKAQYSDADAEIFSNESDSLGIDTCETAGYVFQDSLGTVKCDTLKGMNVPNVTLVIMDYSTDQILRAFNSEEGYGIRYSPGNEKEFYAVAFHEDYEIYVTHPIKVMHGEESRYWTTICLEKKESQYTPPSRLRNLLLNTDQGYSIVPPQYYAVFSLKKDGKSFGNCYGRTTESGILIWGQGTYFSLNTDYMMELWLKESSDSDSIESTHQTFDGSVRNTNQIDLHFEFNQEDGNT